jgi:hypothetical protein
VSRGLLVFLLAIGLGLYLTACGGGDSDEDQVADVIEEVITTSADEHCTELETLRFLEQVNFETGQQAVESCKDAEPDANADSVEVRNVQVDGDQATADAVPVGSVFDGQTLRLSLLKEGDQWQLDHLDDIVDFDQDRFADAFAEALQVGIEPATAAQAECVRNNFATGPPDVVEAAILSGDPEELAPGYQGCDPGG